MPSKKIAFIFPGQGSQSVGMGKEILNGFPETKMIFRQMDGICGRNISKLCLEGPLEELTLTDNLQPAITAVNLACLSALKTSGVSPVVSAGHSLGEYAALASCGAVSTIDALRLTMKRGELMHREAQKNPGIMAAIMGMDIDKVSDIVGQCTSKGVIAVANHNTAQQIVITGENEPMSQAMELAKQNGGKVIQLKVSGAWHCDLMKNAVDEFRAFMDDVQFMPPRTAMFFNATAETEKDPEKIKDTMARQLISPVRWYEIVLKMMDQGIDTFVEVGPKKVLSGLVSKIIPEGSAQIFNVEDMKSLEGFLNAIK
ncbi:MAG: ACP S-malonyltransferase [Deltaproteobacteria bacterium]|nr:ACP S-malonyltransferase [Deltaproteobacteria bacterium]